MVEAPSPYLENLIVLEINGVAEYHKRGCVDTVNVAKCTPDLSAQLTLIRVSLISMTLVLIKAGVGGEHRCKSAPSSTQSLNVIVFSGLLAGQDTT